MCVCAFFFWWDCVSKTFQPPRIGQHLQHPTCSPTCSPTSFPGNWWNLRNPGTYRLVSFWKIETSCNKCPIYLLNISNPRTQQENLEKSSKDSFPSGCGYKSRVLRVLLPSQAGWWFGTFFIFPLILGISSSQLTKSYFSEGWPWPTNQWSVGGTCIFQRCRRIPRGLHRMVRRWSLITAPGQF